VHLILASASPRRAELLRAAGFEFETIVADIDEAVRLDESPSMYVRRLAAEKSAAALAALKRGATDDTQSVAQGFSPADTVILAADTAVVVDGEILGKPIDAEDGARMLRQLAGRSHDVLTGVSVRRSAYEVGGVETTAVFFGEVSDAEVAWYVTSGEGRDKAGGYAIQGLASRFISRIEGSYSNVVGLPVATVAELIGQLRLKGSTTEGTEVERHD